MKRRIARTGSTYRRTLDGTGFLLSSSKGLRLLTSWCRYPHYVPLMQTHTKLVEASER